LIKTTDNSSGRELSAFLPYSDTHAPVQGLRDLEAKKRNAVDHVTLSYTQHSSDGQAEGSPHSITPTTSKSFSTKVLKLNTV